jgi:hypothetical protein
MYISNREQQQRNNIPLYKYTKILRGYILATIEITLFKISIINAQYINLEKNAHKLTQLYTLISYFCRATELPSKKNRAQP